ncbi:MAG: thiol-disulfide oxidoreductase DCC family protein [Vicinamibacteria bacterium]
MGGSEGRVVVLFDGVCNLCNGVVDFAIRRDPSGRLVFGALQSPEARGLLRALGLPDAALDSLVVIEPGGAVHRSSSAVLRVARALRSPWPALAAAGALVPRRLRDLVYRWVARNRHAWFGRRDHCRLPTAEEQARFLGESPGSPAA